MNKEEAIVKYFKYKKIHHLGYCKYAIFRRMIMYILDIHDNNYMIRKTFLKLVEKNYFYFKSANGKASYRYKFNPDRFIQKEDRPEKISLPVIITFD